MLVFVYNYVYLLLGIVVFDLFGLGVIWCNILVIFEFFFCLGYYEELFLILFLVVGYVKLVVEVFFLFLNLRILCKFEFDEFYF